MSHKIYFFIVGLIAVILLTLISCYFVGQFQKRQYVKQCVELGESPMKCKCAFFYCYEKDLFIRTLEEIENSNCK